MITRAWDRAWHWFERLLAIIAYHQRNIKDAAASHTKKRKERLRAAGVASELIDER
jgi:ParB-like chromosome segregation protein Spo0J